MFVFFLTFKETFNCFVEWYNFVFSPVIYVPVFPNFLQYLRVEAWKSYWLKIFEHNLWPIISWTLSYADVKVIPKKLRVKLKLIGGKKYNNKPRAETLITTCRRGDIPHKDECFLASASLFFTFGHHVCVCAKTFTQECVGSFGLPSSLQYIRLGLTWEREEFYQAPMVITLSGTPS